MTQPSRLPAFVASGLVPTDIRKARQELAHGGWRSGATVFVATAEILVFAVLGLFTFPFVPLLFVPDPLFQGLLGPAGVAAGLAVVVAFLALVWAEFVRRSWAVRRVALVAGVAPWSVAVSDPRWRDTQALLLELRGPDDDSTQAAVVYRLALSLSEAFARRDRIAAANQSARALGEHGGESLATLLAQHDEALNQTLVDLKQTCAVALRDSGEATRATRHLLSELDARLAARSEVEQLGASEARPALHRAAVRRQLEP